MSKNLNLSSLDFSDIEQSKMSRELIDHLFMLKEQLQYTLSNLGTDNWNQKELEIFAEKISVKGAVTFEDLANGDETVINGAYIKSGTIEASTFRAFTKELDHGVSINGAIHMYYAYSNESWEDAVNWNSNKRGCSLLGGLELNDDGTYDDGDTSTKLRFCLYAQNYKDTQGGVLNYCSLKLSSEYRASLEAQKGIFIYTADGYITIEGPKINLRGDVYVNGSLIS